MKILITGGAGFIGSNFVRYFLRKNRDFEVTVLDKLTYAGRKENLQDMLKDIEFVKGDICNKEIVEKVAKDCDYIVNFAAETHVDRSIAEAGSFVKTDILGVFNLLEATKKFNIRKFLNISTDEVYGDIEKGSFDETNKLNPKNPYSATKAAGDLLTLSYFKTYNLPVMITRCTNNYGYYHHPEKFIPKTIIYSLLDKKIPVYGNGKNVRDWIFVEDHCDAIDFVLERGKFGEIYNIAGKQELENIQVVKKILVYLGKSEELINYVKDRPGHDVRYSLNINKIQKLGWKPKVKFDEGIEKTIEWFRLNESWWKPIIEKQQINFHKNW